MKINPNLSTSMNKVQYKRNDIETKSFEETFKKAKEDKDEKKLMKACEQFEAVFTHMLLKNMRNTVDDSGFMPKSHGRKLFEGMFDEEISKEASKGQGIGLAKQMYKQLSKNRG